ncbi:MAG: hypothetical protein AB7R89_25055 [Dehalococcoidia bacterium]
MKLSKFGWLAAIVAVAVVLGANAFTPRSADAAITAAAKFCAATTTTNVSECLLQFQDSATDAGRTYQVTLASGPATFDTTGANFTAITSLANCNATVSARTPNSYIVTLSETAANACTGAITVQVTERLNVTANGTVSQTVLDPFSGTSMTATANVITTGAVRPFTTTISTGGCINDADGSPVSSLNLGVNETADITCRLDIDDNSTTPELVSSGVVSVTLGQSTASSPIIVAFDLVSGSVSGSVTGATGNVRCGAQNTLESCDDVFVGLTLQGRAGPNGQLPFTQNITVTASYTPDNPQENLPANLVATTLVTVVTQTTTAGFVNGDTFVIRCPTALNPGLANVPQLTPGQIGGVGSAIAIGILPQALICEAVFLTTNDAGQLVVQNVAPGTIEISALSGSLVDLAGRLTTNLRIGCGTGTNVSEDLTTVNPNTCQGVRFGVLGIGVGFVELRARYEPSSAAAAAGIREREATATVGFIAPAVTLNLSLSPNPVAVGQNGTATLRFNRNFFFGDTLLIDPTTGLPIAINFGSPLNGTVRFQSSNTAVAAFTGAETTTTGSSTVTTGEAFARCGGETAVITGGVLSDFFGGCDQVAVGYRGITPGDSQISATFVPDLPNAFGLTATGTVASPTSTLSGLFNLATGIASNTTSRNLRVEGVGPATTVRLVTGCNNVVAPAAETVQQVAARVDPASAAVSIWKQVPGTTQFQGAAVGANVPAGVSNLTNVNALDAIFVCVSAAATYRTT